MLGRLKSADQYIFLPLLLFFVFFVFFVVQSCFLFPSLKPQVPHRCRSA